MILKMNTCLNFTNNFNRLGLIRFIYHKVVPRGLVGFDYSLPKGRPEGTYRFCDDYYFFYHRVVPRGHMGFVMFIISSTIRSSRGDLRGLIILLPKGRPKGTYSVCDDYYFCYHRVVPRGLVGWLFLLP